MNSPKVIVIGAGLAGCEATYWLASRKIAVDLYEMRPAKLTEAHLTGQFAELVCSNSFKSLNPVTAPGILKREMEILGSLAIQSAKKSAIGAGEALAVNREVFAKAMTDAIRALPNVRVYNEEILKIPEPDQVVILATGPLTSSALADSLKKIMETESFYFYDAISPIVDADSLDRNIIFSANRYGKETRSINGESPDENADYLNCPMDREQYENFVRLLLEGERVTSKDFEKVKHFEGCMPIEEMADRGKDTLRFGPMKPVGLIDPRTGKQAYAVVQLRPENQSKTAYNLVGFQTKLKYGAQSSIFRTIPGLEKAEFLRLGSMHRNSFVDAPRVLHLDLSLKHARHVHLAGQITGVEGYMESAAIGMVAGMVAYAKIHQKPISLPPAASAFGALLHHLSNPEKTDFQPSGINFGLFEDKFFEKELAALRSRFPKKVPKEDRRKMFAEASLANIQNYWAQQQ